MVLPRSKDTDPKKLQIRRVKKDTRPVCRTGFVRVWMDIFGVPLNFEAQTSREYPSKGATGEEPSPRGTVNRV